MFTANCLAKLKLTAPESFTIRISPEASSLRLKRRNFYGAIACVVTGVGLLIASTYISLILSLCFTGSNGLGLPYSKEDCLHAFMSFAIFGGIICWGGISGLQWHKSTEIPYQKLK